MAWKGTKPSAFARTIERDLVGRQKEIATFALQQLIANSPVDEGAYRGNHRVTVNGLTFYFDPEQTSEQVALSAGLSAIGGVSSAFGEVVIQQNAPYGERIENGWSDQAPQGVYGTAYNSTVERFR